MAHDPRHDHRTVLKRSVIPARNGHGVHPPLTVLLLGPSGQGSDYVAELQLEERCVVRVDVTALLRALTPESGPS